MKVYQKVYEGVIEKPAKKKAFGDYALFLFPRNTPVEEKLEMIKIGVSGLLDSAKEWKVSADVETIQLIIHEGEQRTKDEGGAVFNSWGMTVGLKFWEE